MSKVITLDGLRDYLTNLKRLFVTKTDAESTYETKANAANIYETKEDAATHLTKTEASETYITKADAADTYENKTDASKTYVTKTDAADTYATKEELNTSETTANDTYLSKLDAKATYLTSNNLNGYTHTGNTITLTGNAIGSGNIDRNGNVSIATTVNLSNLASFGQYLNSNGYKKLPGGLLIQWVTVTFNLPTTLSGNYVLSASFPIAFKSTPFFSSVSVGNCDSIEAGEFSAGLCNVSTTGANIRIIRLCGSDESNTEVSRISILAFGTY